MDKVPFSYSNRSICYRSKLCHKNDLIYVCSHIRHILLIGRLMSFMCITHKIKRRPNLHSVSWAPVFIATASHCFSYSNLMFAADAPVLNLDAWETRPGHSFLYEQCTAWALSIQYTVVPPVTVIIFPGQPLSFKNGYDYVSVGKLAVCF